MRARFAVITSAILIAVFAVACGSDGPASTPAPTQQPDPTATTEPQGPTPTAEPQNFTVAFSDKSRIESPDVPSTDLVELSEGNNGFALDLYGELAGSEEGNLFMSPYSISLALAMTYAGAAGNTADEMAETLGFTLPPEQLHSTFNALDQLLAARGEGLEPDQRFTLQIANSIWGQDGFEFEQPFLDAVAENYGAGMHIVDFARETEAARLAINGWVEDNTNDRIEDLIEKDVLLPDTVMVLANAIFFKASWTFQFNEELTADGPFTLLSGETVDAEMMRREDFYAVSRGDGYSAVEMRYVGDETSMVVVMPDAGEFEQFEESLDSQKLAQIIDGLEFGNTELRFPKFEFEAKFSLPEQLKALGMEDAFVPYVADFSAMRTPPPELYISDVIHQAFVAVDEEGTEAAAATAVIVRPASAPPPAEEFVVDRPFIFLIRDIPTNTVLFMGRVLDPTSG